MEPIATQKDPGTPLGVPSVLLIAAVGGAGTMVVELAAVRLLAPWFGSSQAVWTNVIAVVMLALALGYLIGGRLCQRQRPLWRVGWVLLLAGLWTALLPLFSRWAPGLFLPESLALQDASSVILWGSLATSLVLFLPPATALGCVAPLAVEAVQQASGGHAGKAGGSVLCSSTLGSLVGVFGTSHVLLAQLGLGGTFRCAALALFVAGSLALLLGSRAGGSKLALLIWIPGAAGLAGGDAARPALRDGLEELAYAESEYQSVRIVEEAATGMRYLKVNEGFDSFQSVWQPQAGLLPKGYYYNDFCLPLAWDQAMDASRSGPWKVLILGLGGGTAWRVLEGTKPAGRALEVTGVELDPEVVRLAREQLGLGATQDGLQVLAGLDARVALANLGAPVNQIILDCYANQVEIPPHLASLEFFQSARERLVEGGWLSVNLGGFGFDDPVVAAVARTCAEAFNAEVLLMRVPLSRNYSLIARRGAPLPIDPSGQLLAGVDPAASLLAPRRLPGAWLRVDRTYDGLLLTDDYCPMEQLQQQSIGEGARRLARGVHR